MALSQYIAVPSASNATVEVATGTALKTLLQVATPATQQIEIVSWWISFDASAAAAPVVCELIDVNVAATVTSLTPSTWGDANEPASLCVGGTSATGYNATAEGSVTASRILDAQNVPPTSGYRWDFPLNDRPQVGVSRFLRVRALAGATVNSVCGIVWIE